jgi:hypothetical protein
VQVVSDFDMTLSQYYVNGGRGCTSFSELISWAHKGIELSVATGVIETSRFMPDAYRNQVTLSYCYVHAPLGFQVGGGADGGEGGKVGVGRGGGGRRGYREEEGEGEEN